MWTSRERVLCALNHEEPDRVPIFLGTSGVTSMLGPAYAHLKTFLGITGEPRFISKVFQYARMDEEVLERFGSDGRPIVAAAPRSTLARELAPDHLIDAWGIEWRKAPGVDYFETVSAPLRGATIDDLDRYPWPDLGDVSRFVGLREEARALQASGFAVVTLSGVSPFEQIALLRGLDAWLMDLLAEPDFAEALLQKVCGLMRVGLERLLDVVGDYTDVLVMGDDLGSQSAPLISPRLYRRMIKPHHAELLATAKAKSPAKIFFHSDGNIYPLLNDLIDIGVDIINPVQVSANEMDDTARLKREFGARLSFNGAIDTNDVLPHGNPAEVRAEVRRRLRDLAPGGGYILSAVHCLQPDVPPENVCALFEEAQRAGAYPLLFEDH